jgi:Cu2+-exporting ATPase
LVARSFRNVPSHGAQAEVDGQRVLVGNRRLMTSEGIDLGDMGRRRDELAAAGRTAVFVAAAGRAAGVLALADAPRDTAAAAVRELHAMNIEVVMLTGDNEATARRIADQLGIDTVIAEVLPADKSAKITELQHAGKRVARSATASTTHPHSPLPISASQSGPAPTSPSRPPMSS